MNFGGKVALITGATSGIGEVTATLLARHGAHVLVSGRDQQRGNRVVETIRAAGGSADFLSAALVDAQGCRALAAAASEIAGRVDILINNAAVGTFGRTEKIAETDFDYCYAVNVKAPFYLVGALAPAMAARGDGVIVNVSTMVASFGTAGSAVYASSKAALNHLTKCWAAEYGPRGVRVNAVAPGPTLTDNAVAQFGEDGLAQMMSHAPARRAAAPHEIASAIAFLASDEARFVHGAILPADGGRSAS
ncbi:SDR family NAD(P)-dependent oxidoreductase [Mycobacterium sp. CPCC 205372]|uniref:SDR family NAD(P)-dependent oxidoreductase n=1 Tax=Mycobacterium hippophais TaxID=3016340 RepID=A0ABT4PUF7_9MYCO|nr:SDR family oxidoreductase [Mycobacterium hippophais]MCZ8380215.1 SDR family NAD(P)-dependent oxidoreductase [Mycobacterium hippophais]